MSTAVTDARSGLVAGLRADREKTLRIFLAGDLARNLLILPLLPGV